MKDLHLKLQEALGPKVLTVHNQHGDETVVIEKEALLETAKLIKEKAPWEMNVLMDMTAVDKISMDEKPRFELVYHFYSLKHNHRLRLKIPVPEKETEVDSLTSLWPIANWFEREIWDMFGIRFKGHPDLKRILMYEPFEGHPLRKDYSIRKRQPLIGPRN